MYDLAPVGLVLQQVIERTARQWPASGGAAEAVEATLAEGAGSVEFDLEFADRAQVDIAAIDMVDRVCLGVVDHQLAVFNIVAERGGQWHSLKFKKNQIFYNLLK